MARSPPGRPAAPETWPFLPAAETDAVAFVARCLAPHVAACKEADERCAALEAEKAVAATALLEVEAMIDQLERDAVMTPELDRSGATSTERMKRKIDRISKEVRHLRKTIEKDTEAAAEQRQQEERMQFADAAAKQELDEAVELRRTVVAEAMEIDRLQAEAHGLFLRKLKELLIDPT